MTDNPIVWWELATQDAEKSVEFFKTVFGWDLNYNEKAGFYTMQHEPKMDGGGIFTLRKARLPFLALYIQVDDIQAKREAVVEHGGFIVEEPFEIGGDQMLCLFNDPSGVTFAMIQPPQTQG